MPTNNFKPFATGSGANVQSISDYIIDAILDEGFTAGLAPSAKFNRVWRQSSFVASAIAQFMMLTNNTDVLDNGDVDEFIDKFKDSIATWITQGVLFQSFLSGNKDFYVGGLGASDSNDGFTSATPFATLQKAADVLKTYNLNGYTVTVHCSGLFTSTLLIRGAFAGAGAVIFKFDPGSSITVSNGACIAADASANFSVDGPVTLSSTDPAITSGSDGCGIFTSRGATLSLSGGIRFGSCTNNHIGVASGSVVTLDDDYFIVGNATSAHLAVSDAGFYLANNGLALQSTLIGVPSFNTFASASDLARLNIPSNLVTFSGTATGKRYQSKNNSVINTNGGGANFLPGTIAGTISDGLYI